MYLPTTMYWSETGERINVFRCCHCFDLTYLQRQDRDLSWVYQHRAERIAERWFADVTDEMIYRPKGMHWQTFNRRARPVRCPYQGGERLYNGVSSKVVGTV